ncbi:flagellar basal body protein [Sphingomonas sp.]|jgi:flagellar basal-body rod protein FlgB|uniref:flagellar basal body protein n=1 Tax=Sphingomonas sp. TaxID=28214 RepID=UPI002ED77C22
MADGVSTLVAGITREMKHLADRQRVIAQNIANSETPGYKARDVEAPDFGALLGQHGSAGAGKVARPHVEITGSMKALGARGPRGGPIVLDHDVSETKPDGNNVTLEDQLLKMSKIQADFTAMTNLYRKQQSLMKAAIGKNG